MSLDQIHSGLARASIIFSLLIGLYGLWLFVRKQGVGGNFLGVLAAGELLYVAQGIVGLTLLLTVPVRPAGWRWVHVLYGVVMVITLPGAFAYLRGRDTRRQALIYGLIGLFLAGVSLRAIGTA